MCQTTLESGYGMKNSKYLSRKIRNSAAQTIHNEGTEHGLILDEAHDCFYAMGDYQIIT